MGHFSMKISASPGSDLSANQQAEEKLDLAGGELRTERIETTRRAFPSDEVEQTAAIMAALASAPTGIAAADLALRFKGRALRPKVDSILAGLVRMGHVGSPGRGIYRLNLPT